MFRQGTGKLNWKNDNRPCPASLCRRHPRRRPCLPRATAWLFRSLRLYWLGWLRSFGGRAENCLQLSPESARQLIFEPEVAKRVVERNEIDVIKGLDEGQAFRNPR